MGVHISRVKSVDLDSWTDEQMQSILNWGNARANKYWESKLAPGHVPSEAKIENFIRTKYELKRWVMDGPMPDPASLDADGDDDVPLSLVKEKQTIERKESLRKQSLGQSSAPPQPQVDLIGGDDPIPRASTAGPSASNLKVPPPKAEAAPPKTTSTNSSLLGLDFLGSEPSPPPRPASTTGTAGTGGQSRPDLKQSILSLYATAPRPQAQTHHSHSNSFGSMHSPTAAAAPQMSQQPAQSSMGSMNDAFSSLSFSNISSPKSPQNSAFAGLGGMSSNKSPPPQPSSSAFSGLSGGGFFDSKPAAVASPKPSAAPPSSGFGGFGDFTSSAAPAKPAAPTSSAMNDLFDFSNPTPAAAPTPVASTASNSVFNLSQPKSPPVTNTTTGPNPIASMGGSSDLWGGNAWADPAPKEPSPQPAKPAADFGWGGSSMGGSFASTSVVPGAAGMVTQQPKVAADEEFGGWTSSTGTISGGGSGGGKGFGGSEDLFSNVWQ